MRDDVENFVVEKIEDERGFVRGDFLRAVEIFWLTVKTFMSQREMPVIKVKNWGTFMPEYRLVIRNIKREIKKIRISKGERSKSKLYLLFEVRRTLIQMGQAPKLYYYRKMFRNGRNHDTKEYKAYQKLIARLRDMESRH